MIKPSIMPIFNTDRTILLKLCSFLWFFYVFRSKDSCSQKKKRVQLYKNVVSVLLHLKEKIEQLNLLLKFLLGVFGSPKLEYVKVVPIKVSGEMFRIFDFFCVDKELVMQIAKYDNFASTFPQILMGERWLR